MFEFISNKKKIVSPIGGKCIRIEEVNDSTFSSKMLGDGFAIIPDGDEIVAPTAGKIITLADTMHAVVLRSKAGEEILLHIGIDTVYLNGEGFKSYVRKGDSVKGGEPLIKFDSGFMRSKGIDMTIIVIFASGGVKNIKENYYNNKVETGELLLR